MAGGVDALRRRTGGEMSHGDDRVSNNPYIADVTVQGERVVRMVVRSEYKRWQAAPGLRVSARAFGIGRRIPLAHVWV